MAFNFHSGNPSFPNSAFHPRRFYTARVRARFIGPDVSPRLIVAHSIRAKTAGWYMAITFRYPSRLSFPFHRPRFDLPLRLAFPVFPGHFIRRAALAPAQFLVAFLEATRSLRRMARPTRRSSTQKGVGHLGHSSSENEDRPTQDAFIREPRLAPLHRPGRNLLTSPILIPASPFIITYFRVTKKHNFDADPLSLLLAPSATLTRSGIGQRGREGV